MKQLKIPFKVIMHHFKHNLIYTLFFFVGLIPASGQDDVITTITNFDFNSGIPERALSGIFQDSRGMVWMQWGGVLCQFDGRKVIPKEESLGLLYDSHYSELGEDIHGNIWRRRKSKLLNDQDPPVIHIYSREQEKLLNLSQFLGEEIEPNWSTDLELIFRDNDIYIKDNRDGQLWHYNGYSVNEVFKLPELEKNYKVFAGPPDHFWVMDTIRGIKLYNSKGISIKQYSKLTRDKYSYCIASNGQMFYFNSNSPPKSTLIPGNVLIDSLPKGPIFNNDSKYYILDTLTASLALKIVDNDVFPYYLINTGEPIDSAYIHYDILYYPNDIYSSINNKNLYSPLNFLTSAFPLDNGSLIIYNNLRADGFKIVNFNLRKFKSIKTGFPIRGLSIFSDTSLIVTKDSFPISTLVEILIKQNKSITLEWPHNHSFNGVYDVHYEDGKLLAGIGNGDLVLINSKGEIDTFFYPNIELKEVQPKSLSLINDTIIWYTTKEALVEVNTKQRKVDYLIKGYNCSWIHKDHLGNNWVATKSGLLNIESGGLYLSSLSNNQPTRISHIHEDQNGIFWLSTEQGLIRWKPLSDEYQRFTTKDGLSNNVIHAVYQDNRGRLWLSSNNGIMSFDTASYAIESFFEEDGLSINEQNFNAHARGPDGRIYFGGLNGITYFNPDSIENEIPLFYQNIVLNNIELIDKDGISYQKIHPKNNENRTIKLERKARQMILGVEFPYYYSKPFVLEWRQKGTNEIWQELFNDHNILLRNIPDGNFEIQIRARSIETNRSSDLKNIFFFRYPPFYYYWWFWLFVVIFLIAIYYFLIKWRIKQIQKNNEKLKSLIDEKTIEIKNQNDNLEKLNEKKNQLFQNISHELRTPLSLISLASEELVEKSTSEHSKNVELIRTQSEVLRNRISRILSLQDLEKGLLQSKIKTINWNSFIKEQFLNFEIKANEKHIEYQLEIFPKVKTYIKIDDLHVGHIIENLINNALKFTPEGGLVKVKSEILKNFLRLKISDTGQGINPEDIEKIFQRGYQGQNSNKLANPGYGIGLNICKEFIQLLNGKISVESTIGEGSTFAIEIPIKKVTVEDNSVSTIVIPNQLSNGNVVELLTEEEEIINQSYNILVVEDNLDLSIYLKTILIESFNVHVANNGQEGFDLLIKSQGKYDLVISDIMMPILDGFELLEAVRRDPNIGFTPFLFLTALSEGKKKLKAFRLGVDGYITKPFKKTELLTRVKNILDLQNARKEYLLEKVQLSSQTEPINDQSKLNLSYHDDWIKSLDEIIRENISRHDFKITEIAYKMHLSERTFRNQIKLYTGMSPTEYLRIARLNQSMIHIQEKKFRTVQEISFAVGFRDRRYFTKLFIKHFGETPSYYIEQNS